MKKIFIAWLFSQILFLNAANATPITLQHVTTTYVNSGICSAATNRLIFDDIQNMIVPDYQQKYKRKMQKQGCSQGWEGSEGLGDLNSIGFEGVAK